MCIYVWNTVFIFFYVNDTYCILISTRSVYLIYTVPDSAESLYMNNGYFQ